MDECRKGFEQWVKQHCGSIERIEGGEYRSSPTETAWCAWQAAWNTRTTPADRQQSEPVAWMRPDNRVEEESTARVQFRRGNQMPPIGTWVPLYEKPPAANANANADDISVGVDVTEDGVQVAVMRKNQDGSMTLVYSKPHPLPAANAVRHIHDLENELIQVRIARDEFKTKLDKSEKEAAGLFNTIRAIQTANAAQDVRNQAKAELEMSAKRIYEQSQASGNSGFSRRFLLQEYERLCKAIRALKVVE